MENNIEIFENLDQVCLENHDIKQIQNPSDDEAGSFDKTEPESPNWREIFEADFLEFFWRQRNCLNFISEVCSYSKS